MSLFSFAKLQNKITVVAGTCLVIAITACILLGLQLSYRLFTLNTEQSINLFQQEIERSLKSQLTNESADIEKIISYALGIAQGLSDSMQSLITSGAATSLEREQISALARTALQNNKQILGAYIVWEAGVIQGNDEDHRDNPSHSTAQGQFAPYWTRGENNNISVRPATISDLYNSTRNAQGLRSNEWYLCPRDRQDACLIDPAIWDVQGKPTLMSSVTYPIMVNQQFFGITGVDVSMEFMNTLVTQLNSKLYDGQGEVKIVSNHGYLVASTGDGEIGAPIPQTEWQRLAPKLEAKAGQFDSRDSTFIVTVPMQLERFGTPWLLEYNVPSSAVLANLNALNTNLLARFSDSIWWQVVLGIFVALAGSMALFFVARNIAKPLIQVTEMVQSLARSDGDLTHRIGFRREDEIGNLAAALDTFLDKTHAIVKDTASLVQQLHHSSVTSNNISQRTQTEIIRQQQSIEQVAAAVTQMSSTASEVASQAALTANSSEDTASSVQQGNDAVVTTTDVISKLTRSTQQAGTLMTDLEQASSSIYSIVEVISNISEQTNLLALNAAIEAARAGEQGRGFAVVADEVRVLASKTQHSTTEIQALIAQLSQKTNVVVKAMNENQAMTEETQQQAMAAQEKLSLAMEATKRISDSAIQIASAAEEQSATSEDITRNIVEISTAVNSLGQAASEVSRESSAIARIAGEISAQMGKFKY